MSQLHTAPSLSNSVISLKGRRLKQEDFCYASGDSRFISVFDGHGGKSVASYACNGLYVAFLQHLGESQRSHSRAEIEAAFVAAAATVSQQIDRFPMWLYQGSTACSVFVNVDEDSAAPVSYTSMNIGDSRAVLARGRETIPLTIDHKPDSPSELKRILALGGKVHWHGLVDKQSRRPIAGTGVYRVNGNLAVSRALGDKAERPCCSPEPDVSTVAASVADEFILAATDGLWDVFTSEDAVQYLQV